MSVDVNIECFLPMKAEGILKHRSTCAARLLLCCSRHALTRLALYVTEWTLTSCSTQEVCLLARTVRTRCRNTHDTESLQLGDDYQRSSKASERLSVSILSYCFYYPSFTKLLRMITTTCDIMPWHTCMGDIDAAQIPCGRSQP